MKHNGKEKDTVAMTTVENEVENVLGDYMKIVIQLGLNLQWCEGSENLRESAGGDFFWCGYEQIF